MKFTFENLKKYYVAFLDSGYEVVRCVDYIDKKKSGYEKLLVNRVDIDVCPKRAERLSDIFCDLGITATFFLRLHAKEYNALSFENYRIIKKIISSGHEIGYHSEIVDQSKIWGEDPGECLVRDIEVINRAFNIEVKGVASHGGMTGFNNLDFWQDRKPQDYGLMYEGYDKEDDFNLFGESFYISDSCWTYWKCYDKGVLISGDHRTPDQHAKDAHSLVHMLIHPETYYDKHCYESY
jgi:hypothetical protein